MNQRVREMSPRPRARMIGVLYLLYFLTVILTQIANGIAASEFTVSHGLVVFVNVINVIDTVCYLVVTLLFYGLFKPVSSSLSLLAALFSLAGCLVMALGLFDLASPPFSPLLFFGPYCLLLGYLILRSSFLPHVLGVLMAF